MTFVEVSSVVTVAFHLFVSLTCEVHRSWHYSDSCHYFVCLWHKRFVKVDTSLIALTVPDRCSLWKATWQWQLVPYQMCGICQSGLYTAVTNLGPQAARHLSKSALQGQPMQTSIFPRYTGQVALACLPKSHPHPLLPDLLWVCRLTWAV